MSKVKSAKTAKTAAAELSGQTSLAVVPTNTAVALPAGLKVIRKVTLPSLVLKEVGAYRTLLIQSLIRVSKVEGKPTADGGKEKPANICDVADIETGEQFIFLVPAVVQSNLEKEYEDGDYVSRAFYIRNDGKTKSGQRYNNFTIIEVAPE